MIFRAYLRDPHQRVSDKTVTGDPAAALAAFATLVNRADLDGQKLLAVLNKDGRPVAHHNFERHDPQQNWRGCIDKIDLSKPA